MLTFMVAPEVGRAGENVRDIGQTSVLIVEDNALIAIDLEYLLQDNGVGSITIASTIPQALRAIAAGSFQAVFLDVQIGDTTTLKVAIALSEANIPFAFATGSDVQSTIPVEYRNHPLISKPYQADSIKQVLNELLATSRS